LTIFFNFVKSITGRTYQFSVQLQFSVSKSFSETGMWLRNIILFVWLLIS